MNKLMRNILIGFGILTAAISTLAAVILLATSGLRTTADRLFSELKEGNTKEAVQLFSRQVDPKTLENDLKIFAQNNSLSEFKNTFWSKVSASGNSGTLEGNITLEDGTTIPLTISLQNNGSDWKIFSIKEKRSGVISSPSNDKAPSEENLLDITSNTTDLFVTSIIENDFQKLYNSSAKTWQEEITPEEFRKSFNPYLKQRENAQFINYLNSLKRQTPSYIEKQLINEENLLVAKGRYAVDPIFTFEYKYILEGLSWKLVAINAKI